ncbi:hypothetical protein HMPREF9709_01809 [Helcococcus kunzii ATCC 51366]|uniref:Zn-dependent metallo-hydrolase RNA specificity domain-containing protein n=1 Tax=Helcococcus kunzii ATCC 51366 TaxID=883114 RepID=H3NR48_9FIRM|nr:DUF4417 domain-containing protein [Helcococcus kunzii]EHR31820.1 hypothetical protein HMPREF9709_01809 [Helcococcus kunzii ATCC 51366]MCT1796897.1 DUF4417 domain-containing protein [Helcococcus kunzii]MCT1989910.1 DUF4417 domain-containing protein [Helcococcus kunzii]
MTGEGFDGLEMGGIYCISTHGCIERKVDQHYFKQGLEEFIEKLKPKKVLVHGEMPEDIFRKYIDKAEIVHYPSYTSRVFAKVRYGNRD